MMLARGVKVYNRVEVAGRDRRGLLLHVSLDLALVRQHLPLPVIALGAAGAVFSPLLGSRDTSI